jgi:glycine/D-amino acid oxidase-like deaminating enzyme/nitrite reductase/ring-hydroxylating ferredoxin subunit
MPVQLDTTPLWSDATPSAFPKLDRDHHTDVLIVGGGITGLTAAYLLTAAGRRVVLVERQRLARVDTGHTSAHLTMVTDVPLRDLVRRFGRDHAQAVWDAGLAAVWQIERAARAEDIDCDFARTAGYLHAPSPRTAQPAGSVEDFEEDARVASDLGFDAAFVEDVPLAGGAGVRYDNQARFHPGKYLAGLARAIVSRGGEIFEHSSADEFSGKPLGATVNGHTVTCDDIVLATHTPLMGNTGLARASLFQTKLALYTSYVVAARVAKHRAPDVLLWDTGDPYRYYRVEPRHNYDVVIYGGEDHKTGQVQDPAARFDRLEHDLSVLVPGAEVTNRWSGQVIETPDGLPYIGDTANHQFAATGFSGNGMTFGTLGGMMAAERILGLASPWRDLFDPSRSIVRGGIWNYLAENKDYPYYRVRDWFAGADSRTLRGIARGHGRVVEHGGEQVAASRSDAGELTMCSAICTHMGCLVAWNGAERTWDCPCHGSRFKPEGAVVAGPAESPLERKR